MMKQFLRVKQIADQKFQRSEKSSLLTEELNAAEKRVDLIKESCQASGKKLSACLQRITPEQLDRKNTKKIPEAALAQCMEEWGLSLGENSILGLTLLDYAHIQETLANDLLSFKLQVEENVVDPLQNILNVDINNILKYRKQLQKLTSEMDSAKSRYQSAQRSSQLASGNSAATAAVKAQLLKEETEDIICRVDQCRDSLTAEMFNLISREPEMSHIFIKLCQLQLDYHRKSYYMLESALPELEAQIRCCAYQPVFGVPLEEHLKVSKREIAIVIENCVCWLLESAMEEEGLFRIGGSMIKIKKMKSAFDAGFHHLLEDEKDPHNVAGLLKLYLRSLPEPLLTYQLYDHWMEAAMEPDHDVRLQSLWGVVNSLPQPHFKNLRYLIKFLAKLCRNSDVNKMSVQNVAIVIGPNLLWPCVEECALGMNMTATNIHSSIVDTLITYSDWFFPGECEFYISTPTSPRHLKGFPPSSLYGSEISLTTGKLSNGDSAVDSMSSSPTNSSPKSPSPVVPIRPRKKSAPKAPDSAKNPITRSVSYGAFHGNLLANAVSAQNAKLAHLSVSHENLLNASYNDGIFTEERNMQEIQPSPQSKPERPTRPKPPRLSKKSLPPVVERCRKPLERPSVPPPERPDSFSKSESISSEDSSAICDKALDPEDISISFDSSSSSGSYNECQMSFIEDSDNETCQKSEMIEETRNGICNGSKDLVQEHCRDSRKTPDSICSDLADSSAVGSNTSYVPESIMKKNAASKSLSVVIQESRTSNILERSYSESTNVEAKKQHVSWSDAENSNGNLTMVSDNSAEEGSLDNGCHFTGGTPTWFDHYGDDKRQSNTLWFSNESDSCFDNQSTLRRIEEEASHGEDFRTVIKVGEPGATKTGISSSYKPTVSGIAIKLRVNSETQDTRL